MSIAYKWDKFIAPYICIGVSMWIYRYIRILGFVDTFCLLDAKVNTLVCMAM